MRRRQSGGQDFGSVLRVGSGVGQLGLAAELGAVGLAVEGRQTALG